MSTTSQQQWRARTNLEVSQETEVSGDLVRGRAEGGKSSEDVGVDFARVCSDDALSGSIR